MTEPTILPIDREAYLTLNMLPEFDRIEVRLGRWDAATGIKAFARHREQAEAAGRHAERAAVVAALDEHYAGLLADLCERDAETVWECRDHIQAGAHNPQETPDAS